MRPRSRTNPSHSSDSKERPVRNLVLVLGDQLNEGSAAWEGFDKERDVAWMAEVKGEATRVWSHKSRVAIFLAAMRHFRRSLEKRGIRVEYRCLEDPSNRGGFIPELVRTVQRLKPERLIMVEPGEWQIREGFREAAADLGVGLEIRNDTHFLCSHEEFAEHARGRKQLRMEYFYREMRRRTGVLMDGDQPEGGKWNYDAENRSAPKPEAIEKLRPPRRFPPGADTREVLAQVEEFFGGHPGSLEHFDWPVTREQAEQALQDFVQNRLPSFGRYQDAMWTGEPYLYHSRLAAAMNLKLLDPRRAIEAAEDAYRSGQAPLNAAEGFIRQILGWREYVRGVYWRYMPEYLEQNVLDARLPLPDFYWTGETDLNCLHQAIGQTLQYGYSHHIQRLMVTGLFALLLGVHPKAVHEWYLAVYVDAVEWVELPNTLGMSQFADGGIMASKPYAASGRYIERMSNYCKDCRYHPGRAIGDDACPFTTLYWDFLARHADTLSSNGRMSLQLRNLKRKGTDELREIRAKAAELQERWAPSS